MLMGIQPGHDTRAALAAASLRHEGAIKADPLTSQAVEIRRTCVWISIAAELGSVVLRYDEQDVRLLSRDSIEYQKLRSS